MGKTERIFQPVKFTYGQIHIAGGYTKGPLAAKSRVVEGEGTKTAYIRQDVSQRTVVGIGNLWTKYCSERICWSNAVVGTATGSNLPKG